MPSRNFYRFGLQIQITGWHQIHPPADVLACNVSNSGSFNKLSTANTFPPTVYDLGENTSYPLNVRLYYNTYETPNEFSIYKYPTNEFVLTSNWKGVANYKGPWGSVLTGGYYLNTAKQGYIDFTATQRYYKVVVEKKYLRMFPNRARYWNPQ